MILVLVVLYAFGFIIPSAAAVVAYRRTMRIAPKIPPGRPTYVDVQRWVEADIPNLFRDRMSAVKWPAIWALVGLGCSTMASIIAVV